MLLTRQPLGPLQSLEKSARGNAAASPPRISPREQHKVGETVAGRGKRLSVAAEPGTASVGTAEIDSAVSDDRAALEPTKQLRLQFGTANLPHPDKSDYGGEDAYFTSSVGGGAFGIADGVGGWQDSGINPAEYSRTFMRLACAYLEGKTVKAVSAAELAAGGGGVAQGQAVTPANASLGDEPPNEPSGEPESMKTLTPKGALESAHAGTRLPGSTTACVMRLNRPTSSLSAANLGDSGFLLIRNGKAVFRTPALQHFFDCPLQFAACPDFTSATDTTDDAGIYELPLQAGDIIVAGTDGLWDNVQQEEILEFLRTESSSMPQVAQRLAQLAFAHAQDKKYPSPYSQEAVKQGFDIPWVLRVATASFSDGKFRLGHLKGGKMDDITIVTALVSEEA